MIRTYYLPTKWHLILRVFVYLLYFLFTTSGQQVDALKIPLSSLTVDYKNIINMLHKKKLIKQVALLKLTGPLVNTGKTFEGK